MTVLDLALRPPETRMLAEARKAGAAAAGGVEVFVRQAAGQWKAWFETDVPEGILADWRRLMLS
jgi:shikimate 5-dehydrogenase